MDNVEKWIKFYESPNIETKKRALGQIVKFNAPRIVPILIDASENLFLRGFGSSIQKAIACLCDPCFVEPFIKMAEHPEPVMRWMACEILGSLGDERATPALIRCLDDSHLWVRCCAASALAFLRDPAAIPALMRRHSEHSDDYFNVKMNVRRALVELGVLKKPV